MIENKPSKPEFVEPSIVAVPSPLLVKRLPAHLGNYSRVVRTPSVIVLHCTDGHEGLTQDVDAATEISKPLPKGHERSFHFAVDANSCTQSVDEQFTAWHARHSGNTIGIGIEMCGRADQTREQWFDAVSLATMQIAARLCADLCKKWNIPAKLVDTVGLLAGEHGITTHHFVAQAFKESDHYDPGPNFPLMAFIGAVARAV